MEEKYTYLGFRVKDKVTELEGVATAMTDHINGCLQYKVTTKADDKGEIHDHWIDWQQLEQGEKVVPAVPPPTIHISMGEKVHDSITDVEGIVIAIFLNLGGGLEIGIKPKAIDGKMVEVIYAFIQGIKILGPGIDLSGGEEPEVKKKERGGPQTVTK